MSLDLTLKNREIHVKVANLSQHKQYEFEDFRLDATTRLLYRNGDQVELTPKAVETLIALVEGQGDVISKEELMRKIWADTVVEESNLAQYLHVLRKTLGNTSDGKPYIETLKRRGYRFNGAVRVVRNLNALPGSGPPSPTEHGEPPIDPGAAFERRGAARTMGNAALEREPLPVSVERTDNIYAVSDWRRPPRTEPAAAVPPSRRPSALVLVALVVVVVGAAFGVYRSVVAGSGSETRGVPFLGGEVTRITTTGRSKYAAISPDGRYVAHVMTGTDGDSLFVRQVAVANDTRIAGPTQGDLVWITFAPDGNFIYYLTLEKDKGETELFRVPLLGGPTVKVAHDTGAPTISPDGARIAYMVMNNEESRLIVASLESSGEVMLTSRQAPDYLYQNETVVASRREPDYLSMFWFAPVWSPDGRSIAFPVNQSDENGRYETVMAVDLETRGERRLTQERWQQVGQIRWLTDGLIVTASESSTGPLQLWHVSLANGMSARITRDLNSYRYPSLAADGTKLAVIQNHSVSNIWTAGESIAGAKQIISEAGRFNEIIWMPDGRIAYTSNAGGTSDIWTMNADGSDVRQLTMGANARLGLAVTVDEKHFVFAAERDGKYNLWRVGIDGSNLTRITDGQGEYYPQCTPDGRWIIYQSGGNYPTLRKMPVGGGASEAITTTTASRPTVSPDGKFVAYHYLDSSFEKSRWGIGVIRLEDGERIKRFDFPPTVVERLVKWTRDGTAIAFLNSPGSIPNIWLQPIDGSAPKPLTDFPSDNIIAFNWTADGSQLAVIRGVETSDVLLIDRSSAK